MNRVIFSDEQHADNLTAYSRSLDEFAWKNRIVGLTDSGFLMVNERVARAGAYDFYPKLIPWTEVQEVTTRRWIAIRGTLFGAFLLLIGICAFMAGWINRTHTGLGIITIPVIGVLGGGCFVLGAFRNRIDVKTGGGIYSWLSAPLTYKRTISICTEAVDKSRSNGVILIASHVR